MTQGDRVYRLLKNATLCMGMPDQGQWLHCQGCVCLNNVVTVTPPHGLIVDQ
jgi:hypothetical protein